MIWGRGCAWRVSIFVCVLRSGYREELGEGGRPRLEELAVLNLVGGNPVWAGIKACGRESALSALKPQEPTGGRRFLPRRLSGKEPSNVEWSSKRPSLPKM